MFVSLYLYVFACVRACVCVCKGAYTRTYETTI